MPIITLRDIMVNVGSPYLLDGVQLTIEPNERIGLIGRNGAGKSTLLKIIQGLLIPDKGSIEYTTGTTVATLPQEVPYQLTGSIYSVVARGLGELGALLARYHLLTKQGGSSIDNLAELHGLQNSIEAQQGWNFQQRVQNILSRLDLNGELEFSTCSGGLKRRVLLAQALVQQPTLLLLDEPTNHLDIGAIEWLEQALLQQMGALLFVTHDRTFLQKIATRIIEIDRGQLTSWPGNYQAYLTQKAAALQAEEKAWSEFDKKLAQEETWIRQGIKARRTRNEGRVRALAKMRQDRKQRQQRPGTAHMQINTSVLSGKQVLVAEHLYYTQAEQELIKDFSITLARGDKIGIVGPNGCGKTTLLRLLLGELTPSAGAVRYGTHLTTVYFDQQRATLDENKTVLDNLSIGTDLITVNGKTQHVLGYLQDFLFAPARARTLVKQLSGGERNRLLLARLFLRPANVLVLDEPTNDLDMETLDLLEELLINYAGTVLLISHDRTFLNNVVTSTLVFTGDGKIQEFVGGYDDWQTLGKQLQRKNESHSEPAKTQRTVEQSTANRRLSYKEQRELAQLPTQIELLEQEQQTLQALSTAAAFYAQPQEKIRETLQHLDRITITLADLYLRWETLAARE